MIYYQNHFLLYTQTSQLHLSLIKSLIQHTERDYVKALSILCGVGTGIGKKTTFLREKQKIKEKKK